MSAIIRATGHAYRAHSIPQLLNRTVLYLALVLAYIPLFAQSLNPKPSLRLLLTRTNEFSFMTVSSDAPASQAQGTAVIEESDDLLEWSWLDAVSIARGSQSLDETFSDSPARMYRVRAFPAPPESPSILRTEAHWSGSVLLTWADTPCNASWFAVERAPNQDDEFEELDTVDANLTSFIDSGLTPGQTWFYRLVAWNELDCAYSPVLAVTIPPPPPQPPLNLSASALSSSLVLVQWSASAGNPTCYLVECSVNRGPFSSLIATPAGQTSCYDSTVAEGNSYEYRVVACNSTGCSDPSTCNTAIAVQPPSPPDALAASMSGKLVNLVWRDNSHNETAFRVDRSVNQQSFLPLATLPSNTTTFTDHSAPPGSIYSYQVTACNDGGCSPFAATAKIEPVLDSSFLTMPASVARDVHRPVAFSWTGDARADCFEFELYFVPDDPSVPLQLKEHKILSSSSFTSAATGPGRTYAWRLRSLTASGIGNGSWTNLRQFSTRVTQ